MATSAIRTEAAIMPIVALMTLTALSGGTCGRA